MLTGALLGIAGLIYIVLGTLHAVYTLLDIRDPKRIVPDDAAVMTAMEHSRIRLTRGEATMWQGWVGFNLSHSLGALMFGAACWIVAACFRVFAFSPWVLAVLTAISAAYLLLARRYWFRIPVLGTASATGCILLGWLLYAV
jgi:hypothetical protein